MRVSLRSTVAVLAASTLALVIGAGTVGADNKGKGVPKRVSAAAASIYTDEISDYGVCRGVTAECYNDWGNGWKEGEEKRVLIWTRTAGPRHAHLGPALGPGLNPPLAEANTAQQNLVAWLAEAGVRADWTEDLAAFRLGNYQAVIFLGSNRDMLDDPAQTTLMQFIRGGGGFVGIHNAFGGEYHWKYYEGLLGGANFYDHGPNRDGTVETVNRRDASTRTLPRTWAFKDEWYNLVPYPSFVNVLAEVDPATSLFPTTSGRSGHPGHGEEHPVSWCHYYDGGRSWLTTLGHDVAAWNQTPLNGDEYFKQHVVSGVQSAMGVLPFCR